MEALTTNKRAFLLLEMIIAMFLMVFGFFLVISMMHRAQRSSTSQRLSHDQLVLAEQVASDLRSWAQDEVNYRLHWNDWDGKTVQDAAFPEFQAVVHCQPAGLALASPCTRLEANYPVAQSRMLQKVVTPFEVTVTHPKLSPYSLLSYVAEPLRTLAPNSKVEVTLVSGSLPLAQDGEATFQAQLNDLGGNPLQGVSFHWYLLCQDGNATMLYDQATRDGRQMTLRHRLNLSSGLTLYSPGTVRVQAVCRYRGQILMNGSSPDRVVQLL